MNDAQDRREHDVLKAISVQMMRNAVRSTINPQWSIEEMTKAARDMVDMHRSSKTSSVRN